jgi:hypothetical protein
MDNPPIFDDNTDNEDNNDNIITNNNQPTTPSSTPWWDDLLNLQSFVDSTERAVSETASFLREGAQETLQETINVITETNFYRNNLAYIPEENENLQQHPNNNATTTILPPRSQQSTPNYTTSSDDDNQPDFNTTTTTTDNQPNFNPNNDPHYYYSENPLSNLSLPISTRLNLSEQSIGYIKLQIGPTRNVSIDNSFDPEHTRPYICINLGSAQRFVSGIGKPTTNTGEYLFTDYLPQDGLFLVAQDIGADLVIELWNKNILLADTLMGKVVIPLANIVPSIQKAMKHQRYAPYVVDKWFEFYALKKKKFTPASRDIANTGIDRVPPPGLGFIKIHCELHLHGRISMWAGYAMPPMEEFSPVPIRPQPTGDLKFISQINETGRGFKRNFQRVKKAFAKLASRGDHAWVPVRFANRARNLQDPASTVFLIVFAVHVCLISNAWSLPLNFFLVALVSTLTVRGSSSSASSKKNIIIYNDEIHDPDDLLGPVQKVAKMIYLLEKFERWMGVAADNIERMINIFNFADERVTVAALLFLGGICTLLSIILYVLSPGYVGFFIFSVWFVQGITTNNNNKTTTTTTSHQTSTKKKQSSEMTEQPVTATTDGLSSPSRFIQAKAVLTLLLKTPWFVRNIFARVPTDDEIGHRTIASWQIHPTEPEFVQTPRDDTRTSSGGNIDSEAIWLL